MAKHYNSNVRYRDFQVGDLVLRKVMGVTRDATQGKLGLNWEGPYRVASWHRKGTYHLETLDEQKLHHPWNTKHLRLKKKKNPSNPKNSLSFPHTFSLSRKLFFSL